MLRVGHESCFLASGAYYLSFLYWSWDSWLLYYLKGLAYTGKVMIELDASGAMAYPLGYERATSLCGEEGIVHSGQEFA